MKGEWPKVQTISVLYVRSDLSCGTSHRLQSTAVCLRFSVTDFTFYYRKGSIYQTRASLLAAPALKPDTVSSRGVLSRAI